MVHCDIYSYIESYKSSSYYYTEWKGNVMEMTQKGASETFLLSVGERVPHDPDTCSCLNSQTIFQIFCFGPFISPGVHINHVFWLHKKFF